MGKWKFWKRGKQEKQIAIEGQNERQFEQAIIAEFANLVEFNTRLGLLKPATARVVVDTYSEIFIAFARALAFENQEQAKLGFQKLAERLQFSLKKYVAAHYEKVGIQIQEIAKAITNAVFEELRLVKVGFADEEWEEVAGTEDFPEKIFTKEELEGMSLPEIRKQLNGKVWDSLDCNKRSKDSVVEAYLEKYGSPSE